MKGLGFSEIRQVGFRGLAVFGSERCYDKPAKARHNKQTINRRIRGVIIHS